MAEIVSNPQGMSRWGTFSCTLFLYELREIEENCNVYLVKLFNGNHRWIAYNEKIEVVFDLRSGLSLARGRHGYSRHTKRRALEYIETSVWVTRRKSQLRRKEFNQSLVNKLKEAYEKHIQDRTGSR